MTDQREAKGGGEDFEKGSAIVPDLFYDLISRIVPGAVFLFLYWGDIAKLGKVPELHLGFDMLIVAYIVGLLLDAITQTAAYFVCWLYWLCCGNDKERNDKERKADKKGFQGNLLWLPDPNGLEASPGNARKDLLKIMAEKACLRVMAFLAFMSICPMFRPELLKKTVKWWNTYYSIGTFLLLAFCWIKWHKTVRHRHRVAEKLYRKPPTN